MTPNAPNPPVVNLTSDPSRFRNALRSATAIVTHFKPQRGHLASSAAAELSMMRLTGKPPVIDAVWDREHCADCGREIGPGRAGRCCKPCRGLQ